MLAYIARRLLLVIPTLLGIMIINFVIVQAAPGGPVEQMLAQISGQAVDATARISGDGGDSIATSEVGADSSANSDSKYRGSRGLEPELVAEIEKLYGFDKPPLERLSISLGLWTTLLVYLISIPLGIKKAIRDGSSFDVWSSAAVIIGNAIPSFLFAILLVVLFAGGTFFDWFPLRGLTSDGFESMPWWQKIIDYLWPLALPITAMVIGGFASLTMLTKNSFLDEINKQYVLTAKAKGLTESKVLYGHVFRNAMLIVVAGFPAAFVGILFSSSLLIEVIFSLDGLGLLGFEAAINRDYPVMFAILYFFTLVGMLMQIIRDVMYTIIDPRIDFEARKA